MDENQVLELVEFYEDMIEKQDEISEAEQVHQEPGNRTFSFAKYAECRSERR